MTFQRSFFWGFFLMILCGCAQPAVQEWLSAPPRQTIARDAYDLQTEPIKSEAVFFVGFRLSLKNKTDRPLMIDWNSSRFIYKGKDEGVLIFKGIDPQTIQGEIPDEEVLPGRILEKEIFPMRMIAFVPGQYRAETGNRGFMPGPLPAGINSIFLVLKQDGRIFRETSSFNLRVAKLSAE